MKNSFNKIMKNTIPNPFSSQFSSIFSKKNEIGYFRENKIIYPFLKKELPDHPEERIRLQMIHKLINLYSYPKERIEIEFPVKFKEFEKPKRADIVIFSDDKKKKPFIVVELKTDFKKAESEAKKYAVILRAEYCLASDGSQEKSYKIIDRYPETAEEYPLPIAYGKVVEYKYIKGDEKWDIKEQTLKDLKNIFKKCHDVIWAGGKRDPAVAFDEMSKLLFAKLYDERNTPVGKYYRFQTGTNETEDVVAARVKDLYNEARQVDPYIYKEDISLPSQKIYRVVKILEGISLLKTDLDAKGRAFEQFLSTVFRGSLGQYFTPREIVEFMVSFIGPTERDVIIDPACGSGGFLLYCLKKVSEDINRNYKGDQRTIDRKIYDFSHYNLYGIEFNDKIARVAMMDMVISDDGHTNIIADTAFNKSFPNNNIKLDNFTLLLTNPPFGNVITKDDKDQLGESELSDFEMGKNRDSQRSEILFIERSLDFVKDGGKIGIVLPDGILTNPSQNELLTRKMIMKRSKILAIISIPEFAFKPSGKGGAKTSLVFLQKFSEEEIKNINQIDYEILMAVATHIGFDSIGNPDINDLPNILAGKHRLMSKIKFSTLDIKNWSPYAYIDVAAKSGFKNLKKLTDLVEIRKEEIRLSNHPNEIFKLPAISKDGSIKLRITKGEMYGKDIKYKSMFRAYTGDIILSRINPADGSVAILPPELNGAIFSQEFHILKPKSSKFNSIYIWHVLRSEFVKQQLRGLLTGGSRLRLPERNLSKIKVPIDQKLVKLSIEISKKMSEIERYKKDIFDLSEKFQNELYKKI
jgi:type I restriction enzyme M protein